VLRGGRAQPETGGQVRGADADAAADGRPRRGPADVRRTQPGRPPVRRDGQLPAVQDAPHHRYVFVVREPRLAADGQRIPFVRVTRVSAYKNGVRVCTSDLSFRTAVTFETE